MFLEYLNEALLMSTHNICSYLELENLSQINLTSNTPPWQVLWENWALQVKASYCKCPKTLYTKISDKMAYANNAGPDQTAPEGAVWSGPTLFAISLSILRYNYMYI